MIKLPGKKIKIAVFISGTGSNLKNLIIFSKRKNYEVKLVISNKRNAKGLIFAKQYKIPTKVYYFKKLSEDEKKILDVLLKKKIKFICLAGFMKILSSSFIKKFKGKIVNIHPSLLPKYKGLNTHARVLNNKEKYSGCTVHFVNSKLDSGKIILQKKIKVLKNDTARTLQKRILKEEHKIYPKALEMIIN
jgi:formyltetrahydrofolate-dependent phosphoribosylglycinamide formyltransferase